MAYGLEIYNAAGGLRFSNSSRIFRLHSVVTHPLPTSEPSLTTPAFPVMGMADDGRWTVVPIVLSPGRPLTWYRCMISVQSGLFVAEIFNSFDVNVSTVYIKFFVLKG